MEDKRHDDDRYFTSAGQKTTVHTKDDVPEKKAQSATSPVHLSISPLEGSGRRSPKNEAMERIRAETPLDNINMPPRSPKKQTRSSSMDRGSFSSVASDDNIPYFKERPPQEWPSMLIRKLKLCSAISGFSEDATPRMVHQRDTKYRTLLELCDISTSHSQLFTESSYEHLIQMFSVNILRPLPPRINPTGEEYDPEEDEPVLETSWPHLQLIYVLFIRFLESPHFDANAAKKYIDNAFVLHLLPLFDSEDPRERDMLKTTLHRVYGKLLPLRAFIRQCFAQVFDEASSGECQHALSELLEILGSIVNGFAIPLKEEHVELFTVHLLPLHKCRHLSTFYNQLVYCVVQFVDKDPQLATSSLSYLLKVWPRHCSTKEVMFVNECEEVLDISQPDTFPPSLQQKFFQRISQCVSSMHFQVSERALYLFTPSSAFIKLLRSAQSLAYPAIIPSLLSQSTHHWNKNVQSLILKALRIMMDLNPELYRSSLKHAPPSQPKTKREREGVWEQLEQMRVGGSLESSGVALPNFKLTVSNPEVQVMTTTQKGEPITFQIPDYNPPQSDDQFIGDSGRAFLTHDASLTTSDSEQRLRRKSALPKKQQVPVTSTGKTSREEDGQGTKYLGRGSV